jgi:hypothetical protein
MLHGLTLQDHNAMTLSILQQSNFDFFLTGSRFFGTERSDSDYDFFAKFDLSIFNFLAEQGFIRFDKQNSPYADSNLQSLWQKGNIQIQLQVDADKKNKVQQWMLINGFNFSENKTVARQQWTALYASLKLD